ncbi:MAG: PTS sugar transporter subunit IIA [Kiritimatiellae bacterium]|nr:PTS sugar transporter subunit IIA [Kiritimatiellia bacterium]
MKSQINTLRQLQELVLTRDEHNQTGDGSHLDSLNDAIDALQQKLTPQVAGLYDRLYKKNHIVISAMTNNCCAVCGMQVPISQVQQVRLCQHLVTCSSCGRILFAADEDAVMNTAEAPDRDNPKTGISRFSAAELMIPELNAATREDAIARLAEAMERHGFISSADNLTAAALERESVLSTAIDGGIAFPHVRGVEGGGLTLAMGVSKKGIDWGGEKVNIVFLSAIPVAVSAFYLRLMAGLTQSFAKDAARKAVVDLKDSASLWKALQKFTRTAVK